MTNPPECDTVASTESPHTGTDDPENVVYGYCIALYDALKKEASDGQFVGSVTEVYKALGISNQHYSVILRALVETGSLEHIQRGHHMRPTIYRLIHRPTKTQLREFDFLTPRTRRARVSEAALLKRVEELERRVGKVDVIPALQNLESRLKAIEKKREETK